jgi:hypothetical protein
LNALGPIVAGNTKLQKLKFGDNPVCANIREFCDGLSNNMFFFFFLKYIFVRSIRQLHLGGVGLGDEGLALLTNSILKEKTKPEKKISDEIKGHLEKETSSDKLAEVEELEKKSSLLSLGLRNNNITGLGAISLSRLLQSKICCLTDIQLKGI